jgi:hypothetical protein
MGLSVLVFCVVSGAVSSGVAVLCAAGLCALFLHIYLCSSYSAECSAGDAAVVGAVAASADARRYVVCLRGQL